ncbi:MAG: helix-turn-helix domain-containing protein [Rhodospirillaceae bacterium]|nr:helix-turn-helix domain-containing protein [Rhodospirillaceae bacterium]
MVTIGPLARTSGTTVQTIRYYEQIGLMPAADRSAGNQRLYGQAHIDRLVFIRHCRDMGFPLEAVRELLALADDPDHACADADRIARRHLAEVERKLATLGALKTELQRMIAECGGGRIADCRVIEVLSDHQHCLADDHGPSR